MVKQLALYPLRPRQFVGKINLRTQRCQASNALKPSRYGIAPFACGLSALGAHAIFRYYLKGLQRQVAQNSGPSLLDLSAGLPDAGRLERSPALGGKKWQTRLK